MKARLRLRIRTLILSVQVLALGLPLLAFFLLPLLQTSLLRQTEADLLTQGHILAAAYAQAWQSRHSPELLLAHSVPDVIREANPDSANLGPWRPVQPKLDAESPVEPANLPADPDVRADPLAQAVGQDLKLVLLETERITLSGLHITDSAGVIAVSSLVGRQGSLAHWPEVQRALNGETVSLVRERPGPLPEIDWFSISRRTPYRVHVTVPVRLHGRLLGVVVLFRTPQDALQSVLQMRELLWPYAFGSGLLLLSLSLLLSRWLSQPVRRLLAYAQQLDQQPDARPDVARFAALREWDELAEVLHQSAQRLQHRLAYIQQFARQTTHELKTPLMVISGSAEILRDHADLPRSDQLKFVGNILEETERTRRLLQGLLELARAEALPAQQGQCDAAVVLRHVADRYREQFDSLQQEWPEHCAVLMAEEFLDTVLRNLVENAQLHGGRNLQLQCRRDGARAVITVQDNGPGFSVETAEHAFETFWTTARDRGGSGLGLSIARALVEAHGGRIGLRTMGSPCCFEVQLPLAKD